MPSTPLSPCVHGHRFDGGNVRAERNTRLAVYITAVMMVVEIAGGYLLNSMALLADGWHMGSHAVALGITVTAYALARRLSVDGRFAFGTWKIEVLGAFSSALLLAVVAALMVVQSVERLLAPQPIHYRDAIAIGVVGLLVNLVCAWLLKDAHGHSHSHGHGHDHGHSDHAATKGPAPGVHRLDAVHGHAHADGGTAGPRHDDVNLRSAYMHVVADAATSVLAIAALLGGLYFGADWLDPAMGLLGSALIARWAWGLLRESGMTLLDAEMDSPVVAEIREVVAAELPAATIVDLHVWRVGKDRYACILGLSSSEPIVADEVRRHLAVHEELVHVTVEIVPSSGRMAATA